MREEATQKSPSEFSDEEWNRGALALEKLLPLQEAAFKRIAVDKYGIQLANARNYLWVAAMLMTAGVAFFDRSHLWEGPFSFLSVVALALLVLMFIGALSAFIRGLVVVTGNDDIEPTEFIEDQIRIMEEGSFSPEAVYNQRFDLSDGYIQGLEIVSKGLNRRGRQLRMAGLDVRFSIGCGLCTLIFYWLSRL